MKINCVQEQTRTQNPKPIDTVEHSLASWVMHVNPKRLVTYFCLVKTAAKVKEW
jgi:hypothetical protein